MCIIIILKLYYRNSFNKSDVIILYQLNNNFILKMLKRIRTNNTINAYFCLKRIENMNGLYEFFK